jgi:hypothetical protein
LDAGETRAFAERWAHRLHPPQEAPVASNNSKSELVTARPSPPPHPPFSQPMWHSLLLSGTCPSTPLFQEPRVNHLVLKALVLGIALSAAPVLAGQPDGLVTSKTKLSL